MAETDGPRSARETDHIRLSRQVKALAFTVRGVEVRLAALEEACADAREDLVAAREVDEALGLAIDRMLEDVATGR